MRCIWAVVALLLLACGALAQTSPFQITWSTYRSGEYSSIKTFQTFTMRRQSDFATYWAKSTGNPSNTAPNDIDWLKYEALAVHLGERKSAGYSVYVQSIDMVTGANYNVHAIEQVPSGSASGSVVTSPFTIILLPRRYAQYNVSVIKEAAPGGGGWQGGGGQGHGGHGDDNDDRDDGRRDGYRLIERGYLSYGPSQMAMTVIRSKREWNRFWDDATDGAEVTVIGRSRSRSIDWDRNQVVVLQAGQDLLRRPLNITRVKKTPKGYRVEVVRQTWRKDTDSFVYPYVIIEVAGHTGKFDINVTYAPRGG